jgi:hypothetical protein
MAAANSPVLLCNYHLVPEFTWPMHEPSESWLDICDIAAPQVFNRVNLDTAAMADYKSCDKTSVRLSSTLAEAEVFDIQYLVKS